MPALGSESSRGPTPRTFTLACLGDVMIAGSALEALRRMGAQSMTSRLWGAVSGADAVLANLESPVTDAPLVKQDKRYNFKCPDEVLSLFDSRFVLGLANNHIMDYGERGLLDTIAALDKRGLPHAGAGRNLDEARRPAVLERAGAVLGVICAADPRFQAATRASAGTCPAAPGLLRESLRDLKRRAVVMAISIHIGQEFLPVPSPRQMQLAELCLEEGACVVSFHHAHCVSGFRRYESGVVFFGMGNYVFPRGDTPRLYTGWRESAAWLVTTEGSNQTIQRVAIVPVLLDEDGLPCEPSADHSRAILDKISRNSRRIASGRKLRLWRVQKMMSPVYLWMNIVNYVDIARRRGMRASLQTLAEGVEALLPAGKDRNG